MLTLFRSPLARQLAGVGLVVAGVILVLVMIYMAGVASATARLEPDRDRWRDTARQYLVSAKAWEGSFRASEKIRGREADRARNAVTEADRACDTRVSAARRSSAVIQSIVTKEVTYDESRCPVRAVVGADRLRDALGLAAAGR